MTHSLFFVSKFELIRTVPFSTLAYWGQSYSFPLSILKRLKGFVQIFGGKEECMAGNGKIFVGLRESGFIVSEGLGFMFSCWLKKV